jgi:hypothetical protein
MDVDAAGERTPSLVSAPDTEKQSEMVSPGMATTTSDVSMTDVPSTSPTVIKAPIVALIPPSATSPVKRSPDLRVQMPPVPSFGGSVSGLSTATTPLSANGSLVQSPFSTSLPSPFTPSGLNGNVAHQSPVRKKLSLSDYRKSKVDKTAASKAGPGIAKLSAGVAEESKNGTALESIVDSPTGEKTAEGINGLQATSNGTL